MQPGGKEGKTLRSHAGHFFFVCGSVDRSKKKFYKNVFFIRSYTISGICTYSILFFLCVFLWIIRIKYSTKTFFSSEAILFPVYIYSIPFSFCVLLIIRIKYSIKTFFFSRSYTTFGILEGYTLMVGKHALRKTAYRISRTEAVLVQA